MNSNKNLQTNIDDNQKKFSNEKYILNSYNIIKSDDDLDNESEDSDLEKININLKNTIELNIDFNKYILNVSIYTNQEIIKLYNEAEKKLNMEIYIII